MAPLSMAIAIAGIAPDLAGSASALFNATRNLGGAVGIALLQTVLTKREQFHSNVLSSQVTLLAPETRQRLDHGLVDYFLAHGAKQSRRRISAGRGGGGPRHPASGLHVRIQRHHRPAKRRYWVLGWWPRSSCGRPLPPLPQEVRIEQFPTGKRARRIWPCCSVPAWRAAVPREPATRGPADPVQTEVHQAGDFAPRRR